MDFTKITDLELENELSRRANVLHADIKGLSVIPLEFLISEFEKRKKKSDSISDLNIEIKDKPSIEDPKILFNAILTPDGTFLSSYHRHDYKTHEDEKTGKLYGVDGGASYLRRIGDVIDCEDLTITSETDFMQIRERFHWGSYGKNGDEPLKMNRLKNMGNEHIINIIKNIDFSKESFVKAWFEKEIMYRVDHNIVIE